MVKHKILVISLIFFIPVSLIFVFNVVFTDYALASTINILTILEIGAGDLAKQGKSFIAGLTQANTEVLVYVDGIFSGQAEIHSKDVDTDSFYYEFDTTLLGGGHSLMLIAQDRISLVLSPPTAEIEFTVFLHTEAESTKEELITPIPLLSIPAPMLIAPNEETVTAKVKPLITGLLKSGAKAHVWIDDIYNGQTEILTHESGTAKFAYKPFLNLSLGYHRVWAVAEDEQGKKSKASNVLQFKIEEPMPAPTMLEPAVNTKIRDDQPFIAGLAKNNSLVKVFIDHKLDRQFTVENHYSGTANFAHKPLQPLAPGEHLLYTIAFDSRGKESGWSNIIFFTVPRKLTLAKLAQIDSLPAQTGLLHPTGLAPTETAVKPAITEIAVEEMKDTVAEILEPEKKEEPLVEVSPEEGTVVKEFPFDFDKEEDIEIPELGKVEESLVEVSSAQMEEETVSNEQEEIRNLLAQKVEETEKTGLLNESKEKQGRLQLNIVIFIVFLLGVIAWIFWVNRELIKERRAIAKLEEESKKKGILSEEIRPDDREEPPPDHPPLDQPPLI